MAGFVPVVDEGQHYDGGAYDFSVDQTGSPVSYRCYRAYAIDVATVVFRAWLVDMSCGRIGTIGRSKIFVRNDAAAWETATWSHATAK